MLLSGGLAKVQSVSYSSAASYNSFSIRNFFQSYASHLERNFQELDRRYSFVKVNNKSEVNRKLSQIKG